MRERCQPLGLSFIACLMSTFGAVIGLSLLENMLAMLAILFPSNVLYSLFHVGRIFTFNRLFGRLLSTCGTAFVFACTSLVSSPCLVPVLFHVIIGVGFSCLFRCPVLLPFRKPTFLPSFALPYLLYRGQAAIFADFRLLIVPLPDNLQSVTTPGGSGRDFRGVQGVLHPRDMHIIAQGVTPVNPFFQFFSNFFSIKQKYIVSSIIYKKKKFMDSLFFII